MNLNLKSKRVTLDWDEVGIKFALKWFWYIVKNEKPTIARLYMSALKGFQCEFYFDKEIEVFRFRDRYFDDGIRLVMDIFREHIHDVLWERKILEKYGNKIVFERTLLLEVVNGNVVYRNI